MLYLFFGGDYEKARAQFRAAVAQAKEKRQEASVFSFDEAGILPDSSIDTLTHPQLFENPRIIILDEVNDIPEWELTPDRARACADSDDMVFAVAKTFAKKTLTAAEKAGAHIFECKKTRTAGKPKNTASKDRFALTDAFAKKDKKRAWIIYRGLIDEGSVPEELHGLLVWQIKALVLAQQSGSAQKAGLNPFVYKKASGFLKNWSEKELFDTYKEFVELYHESHRGSMDLETAIEKFLLR